MTDPREDPALMPEEAEHHQYTTGSRLEISRILHSLERQAPPVQVSLGPEDVFTTSVIGVDDDEEYLLLESTPDLGLRNRVLDLQKLLCSTSLEKIKIQFACRPAELVEYDGREAFKTALPRELMRLQRREYYRMSTPANNPVKCTITMRRGDKMVNLDFILLDISCGGIAVITPPEQFSPELGKVYTSIIHLPGSNPLRASIQARNAFMITLADGRITERSGFAFVNLTENQVSNVQRYIMELERQRKARG